MARVTMNGGIRTFVTIRPLTRPTATPTSRPAPTPAADPQPRARASAHTTPASATTEPTERSMPQDKITKLIPAARLAQPRNAHAELSGHGRRRGALSRDRQETQPGQDAEIDDRQVRPGAEHREHPASLAVLRDVGQTRLQSVARRAEAHRPSGQRHLAARTQRAEQGERDRRPAGAQEPRQADDLAARD